MIKLESLGGGQFMSFLPFPPATERITFSGNDPDARVNEAMASPDRLSAVLAPEMPENGSLRTNPAGSHAIVPLIETDETRRYHALVRKLESELRPGYRVIPLVSGGGKSR